MAESYDNQEQEPKEPAKNDATAQKRDDESINPTNGFKLSDEKLATLKADFETQVTERKTAEQDWDLIERYIYPIGGGKFFKDERSEQSKEWRYRDVYDDTAMVGADMLAAAIHSSMTPAASQWFSMQFNDGELKKNKEAVEWMQECESRVWQEIQSSNFDLEVGETYLDLTAFGNAFISEEELPLVSGGFAGVRFDSIPLKEAYPKLSYKGDVEVFYRWLQWTPTQICTAFTDAPDDIKERAQKDSTDRIDVIFAVYPNKSYDHTNPPAPPLAANQRAYHYCYFLRDSSKQLGECGGYYEMPVYFPRWRRTTSSQWGYGCGHLALPTVLTLNELQKMILAAAEKAIDPPLLANERGVLGNINIGAGDVTVVKDVDKSLAPMPSGARFDVSQMEVAQLTDFIKDLFRMNQLEMQDRPQMTATEVEVRYELMHRLLGSTQSRITKDMLDRIVERTFLILQRAGELPDVPEVVQNALSRGVDIEYTAPLARAQKTDKVMAIERFLGTVANLSEVYPDMRIVPDAVQAAQHMGRALGVPADIWRDGKEVQTVGQLERQVEVLSQKLEQATNQINAQNQAPDGAGAQQAP